MEHRNDNSRPVDAEVEPPARLESIITRDGDTLRVHVPPQGFGLFPILILLTGLAVSGAATWFFIRPLFPVYAPVDVVDIVLKSIAFVAAPLAVLGVLALYFARCSDTLTASPRGLRVESRGALRRKQMDMPAADITRLVLVHEDKPPDENVLPAAQDPGGPAIVARGAKGVLVFKPALPGHEVEYIFSLVKTVLDVA